MSLETVPAVPPQPSYDPALAKERKAALEHARRTVSAAEFVGSTLSSPSKDSVYTVSEMQFKIPLKHLGTQDTETITVTVRAVLGNAESTGTIHGGGRTGLNFDKPIAAYLVGGPGSANPPAANPPLNDFYLEKGFQILYMDYRGTGSSHALRVNALQEVFAGSEGGEECRLAKFKGNDEKMAEYLTHFRQDNIVRDLEAVRLFLCGEKAKKEKDEGAKANGTEVKLTLIGQSFGGWVAFTYLSFYPKALDMVLVTGGVPPLGQTVETVYRHTIESTIKANDEFYKNNLKYEKIAQNVVKWVEEKTTNGNRIEMPGGGHLTTGRFLCLGRNLGTTDGNIKVAAALDTCYKEFVERGELSKETLEKIEKWFRFEERVLYCILQETIYTEIGSGASNWAAEKVALSYPQFAYVKDGKLPGGKLADGPITFYAEHVFQFHYDQFHSLEGLKGAADILAKKSDWAPLLDLDQLRKNKVPIASLCYKKDIFVDERLSGVTAHNTTCIHQEVDADWLHTAVKDKSRDVLPRLWRMLGDAVASSKGTIASKGDPPDAATLLAFINK